MRNSWLALAGVLCGLAAASAQAPAPQGAPPQAVPQQPPPALDPVNNPLDRLLVQWEQKMRSIDNITAQCSRTEDNKTFQTVDVYVGTAKYLKPNLAMLEMAKKDKPEQFQKYICNGQYVYEYMPQTKEIHPHPLPPSKTGQVADDSFLSFLFGMRAEEAKRRFDLKLAKEDQYYFYIDVTPRADADKADFQRARLVLNKDSLLPRQLWFEQPSKDTITWDIPKVETRAPLKKEDFTPTVPKDWKMAPLARGNEMPPPRVVRPEKP